MTAAQQPEESEQTQENSQPGNRLLSRTSSRSGWTGLWRRTTAVSMETEGPEGSCAVWGKRSSPCAEDFLSIQLNGRNSQVPTSRNRVQSKQSEGQSP